LNDLAAAYLVRAQREDQPSDLLRALGAAQQAVAKAPRLPEARFNLALAQEALGFSTEALAAWDEIRRTDPSSWAAEAGEHWNRLVKEMALRAATQWPLNRQRIPEVVRAGDRAAVAQLIAPFPAATQRYLEEEVLPNWAQALSEDRQEEARQQLDLAATTATELARLTGDRYLLDTVELIVQASSSPRGRARLKVLREGHLAFGQARLAERALDPQKAAIHYRQAERALARANSPLRGGAELGLALSLSFEKNKLARARDLLAPLEREAHKSAYGNLWARVQSNSAFLLIYQSRYVEALARYDAARGSFESMKDQENLANVHTRKMGIFRTLGQNELAWREAFQAQRLASHIVEVQFRHHLLGETAASAFALGFPQIALLYQSSAVRMIQDELANTPREQDQRVQGLRNNLAIALRARAAIQLHLERYGLAQRDLEEAIRLATEDHKQADENIRRAILARVQEVEGQTFLRSDPQRAIATFTQALTLSTPGEYLSFRANLLVQRAAAYRKAGDKVGAERDWRAAIDELRAEETEILKGRRQGQGEALWTAYFSRFQETYQRLIGQLAEEGRPAEAFAYAEKARAFEPLNLMLQLDLVPMAFCRFAGNGEPLEIERLQGCLPHGTFLIEYCVLADRTLIWLVSRDHFELFTQPVGRKAIEEWTATLQREAGRRNVPEFEAGLYLPFSSLLAAPLARIEKMPDGRGDGRRLVFVPDGPIHGLPLAALRNRATGRYLIQDFPVSVAASATLYVFSLLRDEALSSVGAPGALLVGDPAFAQSELTRELQRLPQARREVERIRKFYAPKVNVLTEGRATVPKFLELARNSTVVHLAGHAIANPQIPFRSLLLLAPSKSHSGALYAEELLTKLRLEKTRLVVLSVCSSAGGHPVGPEGLAALVRPFIARGAPSVIGSLWNVGDVLSEELLLEFHRHYREGYDAASALRLAQLDLLKNENPGLRSVLAWAPFQVIGHSSSPFPPSDQKTRRVSP
jgi:CHAT domain-containing protein